MSRWRTWFVLFGLVLATPLVGGCLTTAIARTVISKVREHGSSRDTEGSRAERRESRHHPTSAPAEQREATDQPER